MTTLDLGPLTALQGLRELNINEGRFHLKHLEQLTQLKALSLDDLGPPEGATAPQLQLPVSLTEMELALTAKSFYPVKCIPVWARSALQSFEGHLLSLLLSPPFGCESQAGVTRLSSIACLQQLTDLTLCLIGPSSDGQLVFSSLQYLRLEIFDWPAEWQPRWDLTGCPNLSALSLRVQGCDVRQPSLDLRGITGCLASTLLLQLDVEADVRSSADFAGWMLEAVDITARSGQTWRGMQSVHDLIGALAGHLPICQVTVDGERL